LCDDPFDNRGSGVWIGGVGDFAVDAGWHLFESALVSVDGDDRKAFACETDRDRTP
jgi:hypothetical protein